MNEKLLPQNSEAEEGVLGCLILDPASLAQVVDILRPDDFYRDAHGVIYRTILDLYEQHIAADIITLSDALERRGQLENIGGPSYLASLIRETMSSYYIENYARIVARSALHRRLIQVAGHIAALAYEQTPDALSQAEQLMYSVSHHLSQNGFVSMQEVMGDYLHELDSLKNIPGSITGITTGYDGIDKLLSGLQKTDLIILAGRPGSGKTALGTNIAYNAAEKGKHIAVFSLEMGNRQLARRLTSMVSGIDMQRLRKGWVEEDEWQPIMESVGQLSRLPIWMNDTAANPIAAICSQLRRLIQSADGIDLVIVDYLQLIGEEDNERQRKNREQEIAEISRGLKGIAKEFDVPVLALAQLSRAVEQRSSKVPMLSDLRESGSIENDADIVLFIYRDDYYAEQEHRDSNRPGIADVYIAKHRNGPTGMIPLHFKAELTRFYSITQEVE